MEDTIALFVEQSRGLLAGFSRQLRASESNGAARRQFIATFTRMIEDFLDTLRERQIAVNPQIASHLLECCAQMGCLGARLGGQEQDRVVLANVDSMRQRLASLTETPTEQNQTA
jgi:chemotaxis protein histidine kinase CheA